MTQSQTIDPITIDLSNNSVTSTFWNNVIASTNNIVTDTNANTDYAFTNELEKGVIVQGDLKVNGRDVMAELDEMRDALLLIKRDVDMEAKYPKLKEIKDEYAAALAKYQTFDTLKESK